MRARHSLFYFDGVFTVNNVVQSYENYKEEDRLTTNNARKIEFITTARILSNIVSPEMSVLDCAAGTGVYSFWLVERGNKVTATDITPRHIEIIKDNLKDKQYTINTMVLDATDMSVFDDNSFDVVLNMGPFYHLTSEQHRKKCLSESLRVLKKGGLLAVSYIPRFSVFPHIVKCDRNNLTRDMSEKLIETGVVNAYDRDCFWTDNYFSSKEIVEDLFFENNIKIVDHFAQDGITPLIGETVDSFDENQFKVWCDYHYSVCREPSILGASNHCVIIGQKQN